MNKTVSILLTIILILLNSTAVLGTYLPSAQVKQMIALEDPESLNKSGYMPIETIGEPITRTSVQSCASGQVNGEDYLYVATNNGYFSVFNIDKKELKAEFKVQNMGSVWMHYVAKNGMVYYGGVGYIDKYDPYTGKLYRLGNISQYWCVQMTEDDNGNLYFGTYSSGYIMKYDPVTGITTNLGRADDQASYCNGMAFYQGYLYCGVTSAQKNYLLKINPNDTNDRKEIALPVGHDTSSKGYCIAGKYLFINANGLTVYDLEKETFLNNAPSGTNYSGTCSSVYNNKVYFNLDYVSYSFDIITELFEKTNMTLYSNAIENYGQNTFVTLGDAANGMHIVAASGKNGAPVFFNIETKRSFCWTDISFKGSTVALCSIALGSDNRIMVGGDRVAKVACFNLNNKTLEQLTATNQTETSTYYNGLWYMGTYPDVAISVYDPNNPILENGNNHKVLYQINDAIEDLSITYARIQNMVVGDHKVFFSAFPSLYYLGGGMGWINTENNELFFVDNLIKNQSITSLCYYNGILYGTTSIYGGTVPNPTESQAVLFAYDVKNKRLIKQFTPKIPNVSSITSIRDISVDENGKLWCLAGFNLFSVDFETEAISDVLSFGSGGFAASETLSSIEFDQNGLLYAYINKQMRVVNTVNLSHASILPLTNQAVTRFIITDENELVYISSTSIKKLSIKDYLITDEDFNNTKNFFANGTGFTPKVPVYISNGELKPFDLSNKKAAAFIENDVPFVTEQFIHDVFQLTIDESGTKLTGSGLNIDENIRTVDGVRYCSLNTITNALNVNFIRTLGGAFVLIDDYNSLSNKDIELVEVFLKNTIVKFYEDQTYIENRLIDISNSGGTVLSFGNGNFENGIPTTEITVPNWINLSIPNGTTARTEISTDKSFDGEKSLYLYNASRGSSGKYLGVSTGLLEVDSSKYNVYTIMYKQYANAGEFFHIKFTTYDADRNILDVRSNYDTLSLCSWISKEFSYYIPDKRVKYISFEMGCNMYYPIESYYDSFIIIGY